jgi:hypothetical protein
VAGETKECALVLTYFPSRGAVVVMVRTENQIV